MATNSLTNPAAAFGDAARFGEIRGRLLFLIGALIVYRIGTYIPVPGINPAEVARFFSDQSNTIQMMSMVMPSLMELRKEGESGRRKMTEYTRYGTVILATFQSFAAASA